MTLDATTKMTQIPEVAIGAKVVALAKAKLPIVNQESFHAIEGFKPDQKIGSVNNYVTMPDGGEIGQREFAVCYLRAMQNIANGAHRLLGEQAPSELNRIIRDMFAPVDAMVGPAPLPKEADWSATQDRHEQSIRREIVRLAEGTESPELKFRSACMALMMHGIAAREIELQDSLANGGAKRLGEYRRMMNEARDNASGGDVNEVVKQFVKIVVRDHGYVPELICKTDYDGNVSLYPDKFKECGGPWKAGERTNDIVNEIDRLTKLELHCRLPITECAGLDPERVELSRQLYKIACKVSTVFDDAKNFFQAVKAVGGAHTVLTANHALMVRTQMEESGLLPLLDGGVIGGKADFAYPEGKPSYLLREMLSNPKYAVYYFSDDDNGGTAKHIVKKPAEIAAEYQGVQDANLTHCMFLGTRAPDRIYGDYRILKSLQTVNSVSNVPFVVNNLREPATGAPAGMGGSIAFVRAYGEAVSPGNCLRKTLFKPRS